MKNNADAMTTNNGPTIAKQEVEEDYGACTNTIDNDVSTITTSTDYDATGPTAASTPIVNGGELKKSNGGELMCVAIARQGYYVLLILLFDEVD